MNSKIIVSWAIAVFGMSAASSDEVALPSDSASAFAVAYLSQLYRIQAEQCSSFIPREATQKTEILLERLNDRLHVHAEELLTSDEFRRLRYAPVPAALVDSVKDEADRYSRALQSDAATQCPGVILGLGVMTDEKDVILKNMLQKLMADLRKSIPVSEESAPRKASPN